VPKPPRYYDKFLFIKIKQRQLKFFLWKLVKLYSKKYNYKEVGMEKRKEKESIGPN